MLEVNFKEANDKKEQLVEDVGQCRARLDRAVKLMSGLGGERTRWTQSCADLTASYDDLVGDTLVCAGAISYLGVFTPDFRHQIVDEWTAQLTKLKIPHQPGCGLRSTMADPVAIRSWTICGLPQDNHSVENGIIMAKGRRYPLLIDPQGQANRYIKNMGKDPSMCVNDLDIIKVPSIPHTSNTSNTSAPSLLSCRPKLPSPYCLTLSFLTLTTKHPLPTLVNPSTNRSAVRQELSAYTGERRALRTLGAAGEHRRGSRRISGAAVAAAEVQTGWDRDDPHRR